MSHVKHSSEAPDNTLDVEAMVCIWWVFCPLQEGSVELDSDGGGGVRGNTEKHLQGVWPEAVLGREIVLLQH